MQLDKVPKYIRPLKLAKKPPGSGSTIYSVGNPGASDALWIFTKGDVRSVHRKKWLAGGSDLVIELEAEIVEATSPTSPGDSGGPMMNAKGELGGVTQGGRKDNSGFNYFISVNEVRGLLKEKGIVLTGKGSAALGSDADDSKLTTGDNADDATPTPTATAPKGDGGTGKPTPAMAAQSRKERDAEERRAETKLEIAKGLIGARQKDVAIRYLKDVIRNYAKTEAATEAKELLAELQK